MIEGGKKCLTTYFLVKFCQSSSCRLIKSRLGKLLCSTCRSKSVWAKLAKKAAMIPSYLTLIASLNQHPPFYGTTPIFFPWSLIFLTRFFQFCTQYWHTGVHNMEEYISNLGTQQCSFFGDFQPCNLVFFHCTLCLLWEAQPSNQWLFNESSIKLPSAKIEFRTCF